MPIISRFLGITISMYYVDHGPPHFHAFYGEYEISVEVQSWRVRGNFPIRALRHVFEWAAMHRSELLADWELARRGEPLRRIAPLE